MVGKVLTGTVSKDCTYESKTRPSQPPTHRIRELEDDMRAVRALLSRVRDGLTGDALADVNAMLTQLRPAVDDEPSQLSSPTITDQSSAETLQSMVLGHDRILRDDFRSMCYGPYSGPGLVLSVLEFFQPSQGQLIVPEVLNMFDADFPISPAQGLQPAREGLQLVPESEAFELLSVLFMQNHPFLRYLDDAFFQGVFEKVYRAAGTIGESVNTASLSLCHVVFALGNLLSVAHHRLSGCATAISKA